MAKVSKTGRVSLATLREWRHIVEMLCDELPVGTVQRQACLSVRLDVSNHVRLQEAYNQMRRRRPPKPSFESVSANPDKALIEMAEFADGVFDTSRSKEG